MTEETRVVDDPSQQEETPAQELLREEMARSVPQARRSKKDFIESLRHRRLLCLDRAAVYEELIMELGGSIEEPPITASRINSRRSSQEEEEEEFEFEEGRGSRREGQRGSQGNAEHTTVEGRPDRRYKENETEALRRARSMEGGDDGRGEVTDPENDQRLKGNETPELAESRRRGDDGRGEVTDPENDLRLKENLGKRKDAGQQRGGGNKGGGKK